MTEHLYQPNGERGQTERAITIALDRLDAEARASARRAEDQKRRREAAEHHHVTVTTVLEDEGGPDEWRRVDEVRFECTAPADADCRTYPDDCGCESWSYNDAGTHDLAGHPRVAGQKCWLTDWFEAPGHAYTGDDFDDMRDDCVPAIDRAGRITTTFLDEWVEWEWLTEEETR